MADYTKKGYCKLSRVASVVHACPWSEQEEQTSKRLDSCSHMHQISEYLRETELTNQVIQAVTFWSFSWTSLNHWKGLVT